ncbi:hypothetical protein V8E36_000660 [Tilletia maclaganii]
MCPASPSGSAHPSATFHPVPAQPPSCATRFARPARATSSAAASPRTPHRAKARSSAYGDRFIPTRDGSDMEAAYHLMGDELSAPSRSKRKLTADMDAQKEEANQAFSSLSRPNSLECQPLRETTPAHNLHPVPRSSTRPCPQHIITITITSNTTPVSDSRPMAPHTQLHHHIHGDLAPDQPRQSQRYE